MSRERNSSKLRKPGGQRQVAANLMNREIITQTHDYRVVPLHVAVSQERQDGSVTHKGKHWVAKVYIGGFDPVQVPRTDTYCYPHHDFINPLITDSYICHVIHAGNKLAPKGKFLTNEDAKVIYVSRLYAHDQREQSHMLLKEYVNDPNVRGQDLFSWFATHPYQREEYGTTPKSSGIAEALVFNMIFGNWDNKLANLTGYNFGREVHISAFDMTNSLEQEKYHKKWTYEEFRRVTGGLHADKDTFVGVGTALMETVSDLGTRTNGHYMGLMKNTNFAEWAAVCAGSRKTVAAMIGKELDKENAGSPQEALLKVFDRALAQIAAHKETSREWVKKNLRMALEAKLAAKGLSCQCHYEKVDILHGKMTEAVREFSGFVARFRQDLAQGAALQANAGRGR